MNKEKPLILIADDQGMNRMLLSDILEDSYRIIEAADGLEAMEAMETKAMDIACLLLDIRMPRLDGFGVLEQMRQAQLLPLIPVVIISNDDSQEAVEKSYTLGAADYINRPFNAYIVRKRVENTIFLHRRTTTLMQLVAEQVEEKEKNNANMIMALSAIVEFRNGESSNHVLQIRIITEILLECILEKCPKYNLDYVAIANISNAASLHDIGKIAIPEEILNKPARLTKEEFEVMKTHSVRGEEMLDKMRDLVEHSVLFDYARQICRWHHERWDGKGYPDGLRGDEIPICAQVVSLADVYDALTSVRVYKPAYSHEKALQMIYDGECGQFNPDLLDALREVGDGLQERIQESSIRQDRLFDQYQIANEVFEENGILAGMAGALMEEEHTEYRFLADLFNEIIIDYEVAADTVTFSGKGIEELDLPLTVEKFTQNLGEVKILTQREIRRLYEKVKKTTAVHPIIRTQYELNLPTGGTAWYEITLRSMWSEDIVPRIKGVIGKLVNIHEQKVELLRLESLASRDTPANLYNRATAKGLIERFLKEPGDQVGVCLLVDVEPFRQGNDSSGYLFGNRTSGKFAEVVSGSLRSGDVGARAGGDEFMIFLKNIDSEETARRQVEQLFGVFREKMRDECTISMGAALFPRDGKTFRELEQSADQALDQAEKQGRDQYVFYETGSL
ncbi:MAG: diguanylate cyclase [Clostridium sp.]|jgi:putative two-component system response regulator|nr:diguanylate cyclase [Clostridium sp.]